MYLLHQLDKCVIMARNYKFVQIYERNVLVPKRRNKMSDLVYN